MKISQMILVFAADFIEMGDTIAQKQSYLIAVCCAWNIAILPNHKREKALKKFLNDYENANPTDNDVSHVKHDMELLIKEKNKMFPNIKKTITNAQIQKEGDHYKILVASLGNECCDDQLNLPSNTVR